MNTVRLQKIQVPRMQLTHYTNDMNTTNNTTDRCSQSEMTPRASGAVAPDRGGHNLSGSARKNKY
jgi:hypothetical protein